MLNFMWVMQNRRHIFIAAVLGFQPLAYAGPETGQKDKVSYVVKQQKIQFMFTTPLKSDHPVAAHIHRHGDGVKVLALRVQDATKAWEDTTSRGGKSLHGTTKVER